MHARHQPSRRAGEVEHVCACAHALSCAWEASRAPGYPSPIPARRRAAAREHRNHLRHRPARAQGRRAHLRARPHPGPRGRWRGARRALPGLGLGVRARVPQERSRQLAWHTFVVSGSRARWQSAAWRAAACRLSRIWLRANRCLACRAPPLPCEGSAYDCAHGKDGA